MSARKLSQVSTAELEEAEGKLREIYEHFCTRSGKSYVTRGQLQQFATESNLCDDKKLTTDEVGLVFDRVVVGKKPGLKFPRFMEATRRIAIEKQITYQSLVLMAHRYRICRPTCEAAICELFCLHTYAGP